MNLPMHPVLSLQTWTLKALTAALIGAGLVACGGGGGGSGDGGAVAASAINLTTSNRDAVAQATGASALALGSTGGIPVGANGVSGPGVTAQSLSPAASLTAGNGWMARVLGSVRGLAVAVPVTLASAGLKTPQAVTGPTVTACAISGSMSTSIDDRDNSGTASAGDIITVSFSACRDTGPETVNGSATVSLTRVSLAAPETLSARMVLSSLAASTTVHAFILNGSLLFDLVQQSSVLSRFTVSADGPVTAQVHTQAYDDTVTLQSGYAEVSTYDASAVPPGGGLPGRSSMTVTGRVESTRAGGSVSVTTLAPLVSYDIDSYPRSGSLQVNGNKGVMRLTVLSADNVLLELDEDGNGQYESSRNVTWDWLL